MSRHCGNCGNYVEAGGDCPGVDWLDSRLLCWEPVDTLGGSVDATGNSVDAADNECEAPPALPQDASGAAPPSSGGCGVGGWRRAAWRQRLRFLAAAGWRSD